MYELSLFIRIPHHKFARALCVFSMSKSAPLSCIANLPAPPDNIGAMHAMEPCVRLQLVATVKSPVDGVPWSPHLLPHAEGEPFSQLCLIRQTRALRFRGGCLGAASREERTDGESLRSRGSFATCKPMHRLLLSVHQTTQANLEKRKTESQSQSRSSLQTWMQRQERYPSLERIFVMSFRSALFCFVLCFSLLRFDI